MHSSPPEPRIILFAVTPILATVWVLTLVGLVSIASTFLSSSPSSSVLLPSPSSRAASTDAAVSPQMFSVLRTELAASAATSHLAAVRYQFRDTASRRILSWERVLAMWRGCVPRAAAADEADAAREFCAVFADTLRAAPWPAYYFETPPMTPHTFADEFEMVLLQARGLEAARLDLSAFAEHWPTRAVATAAAADVGDPRTWVTTFANLGGDALLAVPLPPHLLPPPVSAEAPERPAPACAHLASWVRGADERQVAAMLATLGTALPARIREANERKNAAEYAEGTEATDAPVWMSTNGMGVSFLHVRLDSRPKYYQYRPYKLWQ